MIKTDEFGVVTVGGMTDSLFSEYATEVLEEEEKEMKIHKEIVWHKGENPKKDGEYLFIQLFHDGSVTYASKLGYTVQHGWNTHPGAYAHSFGQNPDNGDYLWAESLF